MYNLKSATHEFLSHCKFEKNLSPKTIKAYEIDLRQLLEFLSKNKYSSVVIDVEKNQLREYLESIFSLKAKSIKRKIATIKALYNYLEFEDKIVVNPFRKMRIKIKEEKKLPRVLNMDEIRGIFKYAYGQNRYTESETNFSNFESLRNIVVLELLFATGARVSEIAHLQDSRINLDSGEVSIKGKGNRERIAQICNKETIDILKKYRKISNVRIAESGGYFLTNRFKGNLSEQSIRTIVKRMGLKADVQTHVTPHVFRHSFATLLLEKDVDIKYIQSFLGHSSIMTTQLYTHVNREKQKQILRTKHPRKDFSSTEALLS